MKIKGKLGIIETRNDLDAEGIEQILTVDEILAEAINRGFLHFDAEGNCDREEFMRFAATLEPIK